MVVALPLHECGHALAAWLVGLRVNRIVLGTGKRIWRGRMRGIPVEIRAMPSIGFTFISPKSPTFVRTRMFVGVLAGPLVNLALALMTTPALIAFLDRTKVTHPLAGFSPLGMLCLGNWIALLSSLAPSRVTSTEYGSTSTDGTKLLTVPFMTKERVRALLAADNVRDWMILREEGDFQGARRLLEDARTRHPDAAELDVLLGVTLLDLRADHQARDLFRAVLTRDLPEATRGLLLNNVAYADFLIGADELRDEAEEHSERAMETCGTLPAVLGTRGSVLIWAGRPTEGIPLVRRSFDSHHEPTPRALNACALAMGFVALGDGAAAASWLAVARACDPSCVLLERAAAAVSAASADTA
jgi:hypothetical protein